MSCWLVYRNVTSIPSASAIFMNVASVGVLLPVSISQMVAALMPTLSASSVRVMPRFLRWFFNWLVISSCVILFKFFFRQPILFFLGQCEEVPRINKNGFLVGFLSVFGIKKIYLCFFAECIKVAGIYILIISNKNKHPREAHVEQGNLPMVVQDVLAEPPGGRTLDCFFFFVILFFIFNLKFVNRNACPFQIILLDIFLKLSLNSLGFF